MIESTIALEKSMEGNIYICKYFLLYFLHIYKYVNISFKYIYVYIYMLHIHV